MELRALIEREKPDDVALDLRDVTLVKREGIAFIRHTVAEGADLLNCPPYIRRWIAAEQGEP